MRRILYTNEDNELSLTITMPGEKSGIIVTIEGGSGEIMDLQIPEARKVLDALRTALGEE